MVQNQNSLLVKRQNDNTPPGLGRGRYKSLALTREVNLDMQSSKGSAEEIRESGRYKHLVGCSVRMTIL